MGTAADKLQAVLNSKNAIKNKFNLGDIPFSQYAENINTAPGGIVIPENFNPASSADVWWNKQFFNCRGELQSGVFEDGALKSVCMANINGKLPEKYYFLWGWYKSPDDDNLDYSPYIRVVSMPDGDRTFKAERKSDGNSFWWELYDADVGTVFFRSKARSASHEIWEITDDDDWEGVPDDLQGVTTYFETSLTLSYAPPSSFYLCGYVNRNYFSYNTIVVSGMPTNLFVGSTFVNTDTWETAAVPEDIAARDPNGTYTLQNPADDYGYWWWKSENGCIIDKYDMGQPIIYPDENCKRTDKYVMVPMNETTYTSYDYPVPDDYTSYTWQLHDGSIVSGGSAVAPRPPEVEKYWEGYKLEADENGKYNLSPDKTKLTYGDYMPVAGRIYDAAATLEITNADFTEDALWACPRNMTSAENDDWVVSSTSVYDNRAAYLAFDGNSGSSAWLNSGAWWIMWQNKTQKVLLQQIKIALNDNYVLNKEAFLQGSNDGNEWVDIIMPGNIITGSDSGYENGVNTVTIKIPGNGTPYCYYRLGSNYNTGSYSIIYSIEAYAQIPREVPK